MLVYKLFRLRNSRLYPLFVNHNQHVPMGVWLDAEPGETVTTKTGKTKVKSKIGPLSYRPGWHCCEWPVAHHIGSKGEGGTVAYRPDDQVWCAVEVRDVTRYNTGNNAIGEWVIAQQMRVLGIMNDAFVARVNDYRGIHDLPRKDK